MSKDTFKYANVDFTGMRFGRLTVIEKAEHGRSWWKCKCDCGKEKELVACRLVISKSCGCLERENKKDLARYTRTHGMTNSRLYSVWCGMKDRCTNSKIEHYDRYGGRGIKICDEWLHSFENFYKWAIEAGYDESKSGKDQSLDRIDVNGNYEPSNCRWVTQKQQMHNISKTAYMEYGGKKIPVIEFCEEHGITYSHFVKRRLEKGDSPEKIIADWNMKHNRSGEYMSISEASTFYGVTEQSIYNWIYKGWIVAEKCGLSWYIKKGQEVKRLEDRDEKGRFIPGISRFRGKVIIK